MVGRIEVGVPGTLVTEWFAPPPAEPRCLVVFHPDDNRWDLTVAPDGGGGATPTSTSSSSSSSHGAWYAALAQIAMATGASVAEARSKRRAAGDRRRGGKREGRRNGRRGGARGEARVVLSPLPGGGRVPSTRDTQTERDTAADADHDDDEHDHDHDHDTDDADDADPEAGALATRGGAATAAAAPATMAAVAPSHPTRANNNNGRTLTSVRSPTTPTTPTTLPLAAPLPPTAHSPSLSPSSPPTDHGAAFRPRSKLGKLGWLGLIGDEVLLHLVAMLGPSACFGLVAVSRSSLSSIMVCQGFWHSHFLHELSAGTWYERDSLEKQAPRDLSRWLRDLTPQQPFLATPQPPGANGTDDVRSNANASADAPDGNAACSAALDALGALDALDAATGSTSGN